MPRKKQRRPETVAEALAQAWIRALIEKFAVLMLKEGKPALLEAMELVAKDAVSGVQGVARPATTRAGARPANRRPRRARRS